MVSIVEVYFSYGRFRTIFGRGDKTQLEAPHEKRPHQSDRREQDSEGNDEGEVLPAFPLTVFRRGGL